MISEAPTSDMAWKPFQDMISGVPVPEGLVLTQLHASEVPSLVECLRRWYPDIKVGSESGHWEERFYYDNVQLQNVPGDRSIYGAILRYKGDIVGYMSAEKCISSKTIFSRMSVIDPEFRGLKMGHLAPLLQEGLAHAIGAELSYCFQRSNIPCSN